MKHLSEIENSEWLISGDDVKKTMQFRDANALRVMLFAISRGNPKRAARAISNMLSNDANEIVKNTVTELVYQPNETPLTTKLIIDGIRESISFHTNGGGTRTIAAENFVENISWPVCSGL